MIARSITPEIVGTIIQDWPLFLTAVLSVIAASSVIGLLLTRWRVLPGTTAVWGSCPGAASAMTLMAEAFGADVRLVAFMQYLRVVLVTVVASVVARIWATPSSGHIASVVWFPPMEWVPFAETMALAGIGAFIAPLLRIPAGPKCWCRCVAGALLHGSGVMTIELPPWLLAVSYAMVGWNIGMRFTRPILVHALRALPRVAASILVLIAICGGFAWVLTWTAGIDPLTAYLATSPGGARFGRDHRRIFQRRCAVRDGAANAALSGRPVRRTQSFPAHRTADRRFRRGPVTLQKKHITSNDFAVLLAWRPIQRAARLRQNDKSRKSQ